MAEDDFREQKRGAALNLSIAGLILSVFAGVGVFFALAGTIVGAFSKIRGTKAGKYAVALGLLGVALSLLFGALTLIICLGLQNMN